MDKKIKLSDLISNKKLLDLFSIFENSFKTKCHILNYHDYSKQNYNHETVKYPIKFKKNVIGYIVIDRTDNKKVLNLIKAFTNIISDYAERIYKQINFTSKLKNKIDETTNKLIKQNKNLSHLAKIDKMTGLFNHTEFVIELRREVKKIAKFNYRKRNKQYYSLILSDIDNFKPLNDTYGHQAGDMIIKKIAEIFHNNIRIHDVAGRYGGDEFSLLLPDITLDNTIKIISRIKDAIESLEFPIDQLCKSMSAEQRLKFKKKIIKCSMSYGITQSDGKILPYKIVRKADQALYQAKINGRNRIEIIF